MPSHSTLLLYNDQSQHYAKLQYGSNNINLTTSLNSIFIMHYNRSYIHHIYKWFKQNCRLTKCHFWGNPSIIILFLFTHGRALVLNLNILCSELLNINWNHRLLFSMGKLVSWFSWYCANEGKNSSFAWLCIGVKVLHSECNGQSFFLFTQWLSTFFYVNKRTLGFIFTNLAPVCIVSKIITSNENTKCKQTMHTRNDTISLRLLSIISQTVIVNTRKHSSEMCS